MTKTVKFLYVLIGLCFILNVGFPQCGNALSTPEKQDYSNSRDETMEIKGVWAATVFSLDYPSKQTTSSDELKRAADDLLNNVQELGYNILFFQVRPSGDAFYKSEIFPWSKYLTGIQGKAPEDGFDPLEYITEEAHKRGISVHAWLNPYRITASPADKDSLSENSVAKKYPNAVVEHTDGKLYLNPGEPDSNRLVIDGAVEIIRNYNVDGIHIDDYFYPGSSFPDDVAFENYGKEYDSIGEWRRNNITELIRGLRDAIKAENPEIVFSVSPCGIWANKKSHPDGSDTSGTQAYYEYFADTRLWVKEQLVDWIMPQIYWENGHSAADFTTVANWWGNVVSGTDVKLCIGQSVYKMSDETKDTSPWYGQKGIEQISAQYELMKTLPNYNGYSHYRLDSVLKNPLLEEYVKTLNGQSTRLPVESETESGESEQTEDTETENDESRQPDEVETEIGDTEILFADMESFAWAADAIVSLHTKGIVNGYSDGTFRGANKVNRADFTVMLVRIINDDEVIVSSNFEDIAPDRYYYLEIGIARMLGITNGRDGVLFDPEGNITREDMATMVFRILDKYKKLNIDEKKEPAELFGDADKISDYAKNAVQAMCGMGLLNGYENGDFQPQGLATRAETAVFLNRVSELFESEIEE